MVTLYVVITFWALGRAGSPPLYALRPPRTTPNPRPSERCPRRRKLKHLRSISKFKSHSPKSEASRSGQRARGQQAPAHDVTTPGAPCAPRRNTLVSAHCLNSASLSLSLGSRARSLLMEGARHGARRAQRRHMGITARSWARLLGSMPQRTQARAPLPERTCARQRASPSQLQAYAIMCTHMHSDALRCTPMACNQMSIRCDWRPSTSRHPDFPTSRHPESSATSGTQRCFSSHRRLSSAVLSATQRTYSERISPNLVIRGTQRTYNERISPNLVIRGTQRTYSERISPNLAA